MANEAHWHRCRRDVRAGCWVQVCVCVCVCVCVAMRSGKVVRRSAIGKLHVGFVCLLLCICVWCVCVFASVFALVCVCVCVCVLRLENNSLGAERRTALRKGLCGSRPLLSSCFAESCVAIKTHTYTHTTHTIRAERACWWCGVKADAGSTQVTSGPQTAQERPLKADHASQSHFTLTCTGQTLLSKPF